MYDWFVSQHVIVQALLAGLFTWIITALGAATVFFARQINRKLLDAMLGFSGGVMLAASYWSLLAPAIAISEHGTLPSWFLPPSASWREGRRCGDWTSCCHTCI
jgi:zinc transporter, ZIP family